MMNKVKNKEIVKAYSKFYCESRVWKTLTYCGIKIFKLPFDLWVFQEIAFQLKPDLLIETGTYLGGSALFYANLFDVIGSGEVLSIDCTDFADRSDHKRITYLIGDSISSSIIEKVRIHIENKKVVWVILDSNHSKIHVLAELRIYSDFVTPGGYLMVEDTFLDDSDYVLHREFRNNGPLAAVRQFLREDKGFRIDGEVEKFGFSFLPEGYLRRILE